MNTPTDSQKMFVLQKNGWQFEENNGGCLVLLLILIVAGVIIASTDPIKLICVGLLVFGLYLILKGLVAMQSKRRS